MTTDRHVAARHKLVEAVRRGTPAWCSKLRPEQLADSNDERHVIAAERIRDLLRGRSEKNLDPRGVQLVGARITGRLDLDGVDCKVGLSLLRCWFDELVTAWGAKLPWLWLYDSHLPALVADRAQTLGSVDLDRVHVRGDPEEGAVRLRGASIGGHLLCHGAQLRNGNGPALDAEGMQVKGMVLLRDEYRFDESRFPDRNVEFRATGRGEDGAVRLANASIGGRLNCTKAQLTNHEKGPALHAARLQSEGSVHLQRIRATAHSKDGAVLLRGASIGGSLFCNRAQLENDAGPALHAEAMQVTETVLLCGGFSAVGHGRDAAVRLRFARIGTSLAVGKGTANPDGPVLDLRSAAVTQLSLSRQALNYPAKAEKDAGRQGTSTPLPPLLLDGLTYSTIPAKPALAQWLEWLRRCTPYAAQPYQQLASVHRAVGDEDKARTILIAQQDDLRARGGLGGRWAKARHRLLGLTIGYGYRTWRAFVGLAAVLLLAVGLGLLAGHVHGGNRWVAAHTDKAGIGIGPGSRCSTVEQIGLGVERAVPLLITNTRISDRCTLDSSSVPGQIITATGWALQVAAWALATLAIAGYTGLVRKT
jgi:hypothetical protein